MTVLLGSGTPTVEEVVECLNHYRLRASYEAVGNVVGCGTRHVGRLLGESRPLTSWIVDKNTEMPSTKAFPDDNPLLLHPDLQRTDYVIKSPEELEALITAYRVRPLTEGMS